MENLKKWSTSWIAIVIAFIAFWPIGFVLLYLRFFIEGGRLKVKANIFWGLAICSYVIIGSGLIAGSEQTGAELRSTIVMLLIFVIIAIACTIPAVKNSKKYKYYKKYVDYIRAKKNVTIEDLAEEMKESPDTVTKNITKIIGYKMIDGYINDENEIILTQDNNTNLYNNIQEERQILTIKCKNCGATNKFVTGKENRCEYCDSILSEK